ncbi:MAG: DUF1326 domain-containing protein [Gemmatimonadetes bacterium]|nr:DUF1326 domain-containing protein [Gemmatimonadota bacterium]
MTWWAEGLLFENCNCTSVCPGHVHFSQACTHEVCHGFWAVRFSGGTVDGQDLAGMTAVLVYESPQVMIEGGWRQVMIISDDASPAQVTALDKLFSGDIGGPWAVLSRFVAERLPTRTAPIVIEDEERRKSVLIPGLLSGAIEAIRGRDKGQPVRFENIYNQIHSPTQVIARGSTRFDDGLVHIRNEDTHGLWSSFRWAVD